ncbi:MAG: APC family permease [Actinomycetota bacterium]
MNRIFKRLFVGPPISSHEELQHRLPKRIALAVFSSDALSSTAYATDEILIVLILAGAVGLVYSVPIALAVVLVLGVVIFSYRQTVRAYPQGGGAYRVAHSNLGAPAGLVAGAALLIDYILTVSVSIAAGVAAAGAALPYLRDHKVGLALVAVAFITALNLRGMKESGTIFAIPTYGFLVAMGSMILIGIFKAATGDIVANPTDSLEAAGPVTLFLILRAFASGSTALTGIEAISDGVPAFKPPESKNAAQTLLVLGILLSILFFGITFLSKAVGVNPELIEEGETAISQIASGVFGHASTMFYVVQAFTALILFLAANTAYADFPRLASILAKDRYLPRGLGQRGDRLAFSNGILILAVAAGAILINYEADVHRIVPLYVVGVFTSFTLSQAGMVKHTLNRKREALAEGKLPPDHWKRTLGVSSFGTLTTFVVLIIVGTTKFLLGAWQIILLIPVVAWLLSRIRRHYDYVTADLETTEGLPEVLSEKVVLLVTRFRGATKALAFARAIAPTDLRAVSFGASELRIKNLRSRWDAMGIKLPIEPGGNRVPDVIKFVRSMNPTPQSPVTLIFPDPQFETWLGQVAKNRQLLRLKRAFLFESSTVLISIPYDPDPDDEPEPRRLQAPGRLALVVVVSSINKATMRAIAYARSLNPSEIKAMSIQTEPGGAALLTQQWSKLGTDVALEIVDSPFRDLMTPLKRELRELKPNPTDVVGVVVPEFVVRKWWQGLLHTQTAFFIKSALLFEKDVVVINVPYRVSNRSQTHTTAPTDTPEETANKS